MKRSFMQLEVTQKGALYCADCARCGRTVYSHEWAEWNFNELRDALSNGTAKMSPMKKRFKTLESNTLRGILRRVIWTAQIGVMVTTSES